ncbi:MAG: hypothetical protein Ct9H300mP8_09890 [Gammaproteobacteria bacterium]|nr:MAG: hypothetical protein Ct9H300mP8_09890 [Gammaproteobacteria bacterium]
MPNVRLPRLVRKRRTASNADAQPSTDKDGSITVRAYPVREVVDPLDQNRDIHNVLDYFLDCPQVNPSRLAFGDQVSVEAT